MIERAADMRYVGQEHAVTVDLPGKFFADKDRAAIKRRFDEVHAIRYGTSAPKEPADLVSLRTTVLGTMRKPPRHTVEKGKRKPPKDALADEQGRVLSRRMASCSTPVYKRAELRSGNRIDGPALMEEHASTTVVQPGDASDRRRTRQSADHHRERPQMSTRNFEAQQPSIR